MWYHTQTIKTEVSTPVAKGEDVQISIPVTMKATTNPLAGMHDGDKREWTNERREEAERALRPESAEDLQEMVRTVMS